jgi:hypothetical protein
MKENFSKIISDSEKPKNTRIPDFEKEKSGGIKGISDRFENSCTKNSSFLIKETLKDKIQDFQKNKNIKDNIGGKIAPDANVNKGEYKRQEKEWNQAMNES